MKRHQSIEIFTMMRTMMNMKRITMIIHMIERNQHMTDTMVHMRKMKWGIVMMILIQFLMETPLLIGILIRLMYVDLIIDMIGSPSNMNTTVELISVR